MRIEYHRTLITDHVRIAAFHAALAKVIVKGRTTVADIGTGSGILAFLASRLGAKKVYAYERAEIGAVAERLAKLNKIRNVEIVPARSTELLDPPRVDVVVTETLGNYALEENLVETMNDVRARYLNPGGVMIPTRVTQFAIPVIGPRIHEEMCAWDRIGYGLDFSTAREMSLNNVYVRTFRPDELLDGGRTAAAWDRVDFGKANKLTRRGEAAWTVGAPVTVYGMCSWWTAELVAGIDLTTSPLAETTHWEQLYFPCVEPVKLAAGDKLVAELRSRSSEEGGTELAWSLAAHDAKGRARVRHAMSLDKGFLP